MPKPLDVDSFRVPEGRRVDLEEAANAASKPFYSSKEHYRSLLSDHIEQLADRQNLLYAHDRYALLLIFQAMDAAGQGRRDQARHVRHQPAGLPGLQLQASERRPSSITTFSGEQRSACRSGDASASSTVRTTRKCSSSVSIPEILQAQRLPDEALEGRGVWKRRFESIVDHERHLHRNGTRIVKFFLHLSKEEQARRFLARIDDPSKNWKFSAGDIAERARWKDYMRAYEALPRSDEHRSRPVVRRPGGRQAQRAADRVAGHRQHDESPEDALPGADSGHRRGASESPHPAAARILTIDVVSGRTARRT